ncbi:hypothetical protein FB004_12628 [Sinorhizobium medicae]|uniref:DUF2946 domain-containing protein n=1 Tax=Sinorhizobium medicae TaxID=110321 RepID=A0A508X3P2_9HYPH|nr:hypothetical protein FB004_12628 [Sinorhizobium medicae]TWA14765.1 hypothetical protein FB006_1328 [Sinorhizobium medicae]TWA35776.1 hypothetical protein FB005_13128 [Sinorhizobium medicae]VTZ64448.1 conserved exported hypothetical protein [Sinorhizobium medicae]
MLRWLAIMLVFLSAPLSGGLGAAAQARDLAVRASDPHHVVLLTERGSHGAQIPHTACEDSRHCKHPAKPVHPFLCSACIAVGVTLPSLVRTYSSSERLAPGRDDELRALRLKPRYPPPKPPSSRAFRKIA